MSGWKLKTALETAYFWNVMRGKKKFYGDKQLPKLYAHVCEVISVSN